MIARNRAVDFHRRSKETVEINDELRGSDTHDSKAAEILELIRSLPEAYRETLVLRLVEGMTGPEYGSAHRTDGGVSESQPSPGHEITAGAARIYGGLMNDDYLWDKSGQPDPEIQQLEEILGTLRYQPRPLEIPAACEAATTQLLSVTRNRSDCSCSPACWTVWLRGAHEQVCRNNIRRRSQPSPSEQKATPNTGRGYG